MKLKVIGQDRLLTDRPEARPNRKDLHALGIGLRLGMEFVELRLEKLESFTLVADGCPGGTLVPLGF
jgi:hypothetical protein